MPSLCSETYLTINILVNNFTFLRNYLSLNQNQHKQVKSRQAQLTTAETAVRQNIKGLTVS